MSLPLRLALVASLSTLLLAPEARAESGSDTPPPTGAAAVAPPAPSSSAQGATPDEHVDMHVSLPVMGLSTTGIVGLAGGVGLAPSGLPYFELSGAYSTLVITSASRLGLGVGGRLRLSGAEGKAATWFIPLLGLASFRSDAHTDRYDASLSAATVCGRVILQHVFVSGFSIQVAMTAGLRVWGKVQVDGGWDPKKLNMDGDPGFGDLTFAIGHHM